eukprot:TRINITY_DN6370_c0_g1_i1.p1 TRINITY_DN6370_c0_g1~~TRINITY_DN6370_c0_g1_i1.p1  ORF type:complete len:236 (-),score=40.56 TRINITY_DN6370_c0_g1_i1:609-1316(-)
MFNKGEDIETGSFLAGSSAEFDSNLRWGFVRKVYGILSVQFILTAIVGCTVVFNKELREGILGSTGILIALAVLQFGLLIPLWFYRQSHPLNLILLGAWTTAISITVGASCAQTKGEIVLEAVILTGAVVVGLTAYTFWASKRGVDFSFLEPFLFTALIILIVWSLIQIFFPMGKVAHMIFAGLGALVFSGYIIFDTAELLTKYTYDEYIWASVQLYLDVINLFLFILDLLRSNQ